MLVVCHSQPKFCISIVFSFSWELKWPQEKLKTYANEEYYGMLWYFLEWSIKKNDQKSLDRLCVA